MSKTLCTLDVARRFHVLLAPASALIPANFRDVSTRPEKHACLVAEMQRLRGRVYLQDGAIQESQLTADGRHVSPYDTKAWHLLTLDANGEVGGCERLLVHDARSTFDQLTLSRSAAARCTVWGSAVRQAIERELAEARRRCISVVEIGGWALTEALRGTTEAIKMALGAFAWTQLLGGAIGLTTATVRNHSASILSRIGGRSLFDGETEIPEYYDPQYGCQMRLLRFDSRCYGTKYAHAVEDLQRHFASAPVICAGMQQTGLLARQMAA